jgi:hypothetical protein
MIRLDALCIHTSLVPCQSARQLARDAKARAQKKVHFVITEQVLPQSLENALMLNTPCTYFFSVCWRQFDTYAGVVSSGPMLAVCGEPVIMCSR